MIFKCQLEVQLSGYTLVLVDIVLMRMADWTCVVRRRVRAVGKDEVEQAIPIKIAPGDRLAIDCAVRRLK